MNIRHHLLLGALLVAASTTQACAAEHKDAEHQSISDVPGHDGLPIDARRPQGPRTLDGEVYLRSFMMLMGTDSPAAAAAAARGQDGNAMFETWTDHVGALGLPDYKADIRRAPGTNAMMIAAYERLGMVVCERAAERDLRAGGSRTVFDFDLPSDPLDRPAFDAGFDVVHRTMLGYPARLAPGRSDRFFQLYAGALQRHGSSSTSSRLSPAEAGWATVCEGLIRHPELHLY